MPEPSNPKTMPGLSKNTTVAASRYPPLGILLLTYAPDAASPRGDYAEATLRALLENLHYSGEVLLHIADDGSPQAHRDRLHYFAGCWPGITLGRSNSERRGYGGNYNAATTQIHDRVAVVLPLEDDWVLTRPLDLDPLVDVLLAQDSRIGCIRLGYIGYLPGFVLRAEFVWAADQHLLLLDPASTSQYVFSGGPRLETVAWARTVGPWPERLPAGETELKVCERPAARTGVAWPVDLIGPRGGLFAHIGVEQVKNAPIPELQAVAV